uniref:Uncharacterized protein n=1 Tax=Arundo donax TaxID=35708 RepID=A0A0A9DZ33_ARUDO
MSQLRKIANSVPHKERHLSHLCSPRSNFQPGQVLLLELSACVFFDQTTSLGF